MSELAASFRRSLGGGPHDRTRLGLMAVSASALLAGCSLISPPPKVSPQEHLGDAGRGHRLARTLCANCHAVEGAGPSPNAAAPPFGVMARRYANLRLDWELEAISQVGHYAMPAKPLTAIQRQDLDAYLRSLSSRGSNVQSHRD